MKNVAMALGQNAYAYPHQDQLAHIQTHLDFALNPCLWWQSHHGIVLPAAGARAHQAAHGLMVLGRMNGYCQ